MPRKPEIICIDRCMPTESIYENRGIGRCNRCKRENVKLGKRIVKK
jgi:hypothetical protein